MFAALPWLEESGQRQCTRFLHTLPTLSERKRFCIVDVCAAVDSCSCSLFSEQSVTSGDILRESSAVVPGLGAIERLVSST